MKTAWHQERPPRTSSSRHTCVYSCDCPFTFSPQNGYIFCQDNLKCVSARCCLKMFDRGCAGKASATVRGIPASLSGSRARCSDSTLSFRLRCSIIRGWGLHHQVPSSEEFIQPLPQWVLCVVAGKGPHIFCLSFSPFPFISPLKLILLVEPALCWLKQDNFAYDYKRGLDMGFACVCACVWDFGPRPKTLNYHPLWKLHTRSFIVFITDAALSSSKTRVCGRGQKSQVFCGQNWKFSFWQSGIGSSTTKW